MILSSSIKDFLRLNYYVSEEDLEKPFEEMNANLKDLILNKCMEIDENGSPKEKSEDELLEQLNKQFIADTQSDNSSFDQAAIDAFIKKEKQLTLLAELAINQQKNPSDLDNVASLLAAKKMVSEEYRDKPLSAKNYFDVYNDVKKELEVKYYTTQYFETMRKNKVDVTPADAVAKVGLITDMIEKGQSHQIADKLNLDKSEDAKKEAMAGTLSFAMAELGSFSNAIKEKYKESSFAKKVDSLDKSFQEKYPKSYMAAKIAGNMAMMMTFGPAMSAYKAVAGINAMRKDFKKYKDDNKSEKKSFWNFIKTPDNRKKLMEVGQNTLRIIPTARMAGIALSAVKNSDGLVSSIKNLKTNKDDKNAWKKVAFATFGLIAISTTAALANDEVADSVGDFISNHTDNIMNNIGLSDFSISSDIDISDNEQSTSIITENSNNELPNASTDEINTSTTAQKADLFNGEEKTEVLYKSNGDVVINKTVSNMKLNDDVTLKEASISTNNDGMGRATFEIKDETTVMIAKDAENQSVRVITENTDNQIHHSSNGGINLTGTVRNEIDPTKEGVTLTSASYKTETNDYSGTFTDNQSGDIVTVGTDSSGQDIGFHSKDGDTKLNISRNHTGKVVAGGTVRNVELSDDVTLKEASISTNNGGMGRATFEVKDDTTVMVAKDAENQSVRVITENTDNQIHHSSNGGINLTGTVRNEIDPTKEGVTLTSGSYKTETNNYSGTFTDNKSGDIVTVGTDSSGQDVGFHSKDGDTKLNISRNHTGKVVAGGTVRNVELSEDVTLKEASITTNNSGMGRATFEVKDDTTVMLASDKDNQSARIITENTDNQIHRSSTGGINVTGTVRNEIDPTKEGVTLTSGSYKTETNNYSGTFTDNESGDIVTVGTQSSGQDIGFHSKDGDTKLNISRNHTGKVIAGGTVRNIELSEDVTLKDANITTNNGGIGQATFEVKDDTNISVASGLKSQSARIVTEHANTQISHSSTNGINLSGTTRHEIDPTKEGITLTQTHHDTASNRYSGQFTDNQSGNKVTVGTHSTGQEATFSTKDADKNVNISHNAAGKVVVGGNVRDIELGNDTTLKDAHITTQNGGMGRASVELKDGSKISTVADTKSQVVTLNKNDDTLSINQDNGKVGLHARITNMPKEGDTGVSISQAEYHSDSNRAGVTFTDAESRNNVSIEKDNTGYRIRREKGNSSSGIEVNIEKDGDIRIGNKGRSVNVTRIFGAIKKFTR